MIAIVIMFVCTAWGAALKRVVRADWPAWTYYPLGLAVTGILGQWGWFAGVSWSQLVMLWGLITILAIFLILHSLPFKLSKLSAHMQSALTINLRSIAVSWSELPWWWLLPIGLASVALISLWSVASLPTAWDNISLYDWRAHRLVAGWTPLQFATQLAEWPQFHLYDFYHPFITSILSALVYSFGGYNVAILWWALGASVVWGMWRQWSTFAARIVTILLVTSSAIWLQTWTEAYAILPAVWWWLAVLTYSATRHTTSHPSVSRHTAASTMNSRWRSSDTLLIGVWLSAQISARSIEPYWLWWIIVWCLTNFSTSYRSILAGIRQGLPLLVPFITWIIWWFMRTWAAEQLAEPTISHATQIDMQQLLVSPLANYWASLTASVFIWLQQPLFSLVILIVVGQMALTVGQRLSHYWWLLFLGSEMMLLLGTVIMHLMPGAAFADLHHSFPRAALPATALLIIGIVQTTQELTTQTPAQSITPHVRLSVKKAKLM